MKKGGFLSQYEAYLANGHDYVEIAGIKWATMNIGAKKVTDIGMYFQWGDTKGYTTSDVGSGTGQKAFLCDDYKYCSDAAMTKYNATDGKMVLDSSDDAAHANWGGGWRMPTAEEFQALGAATTSAWTTDYQGSGVSGFVLTDKVDSSKVLFFPAAGYCEYGNVNYVGNVGCYWTSSLPDGGVVSAYCLYFNSGVYWWCVNYRVCGCSVRGVIG